MLLHPPAPPSPPRHPSNGNSSEGEEVDADDITGDDDDGASLGYHRLPKQ